MITGIQYTSFLIQGYQLSDPLPESSLLICMLLPENVLFPF